MTLQSFRTDERGASAAEFALVLPLLILLLFGMIDAGRFAWEYNRAEKATQVGARFAVVTDPVASALATESYVVSGVRAAGDPIPASALGDVQCNSSACSCQTSPCPALTRNAAAFTNLVARMRLMKPDIAAANVQVDYRGSGLGFAGDPSGMPISPLVTVSLRDLQFRPLTAMMLTTITMPDFRTTLTGEDSAGAQSN